MLCREDISSCSYSEIPDEIKFMHVCMYVCMYVCMLPLAGLVRTLSATSVLTIWQTKRLFPCIF